MKEALHSFALHRAPLKIVVKGRDEVELTRGWIEHHASIVGLENLLVIDNNSSLPEVFDIYESFGPTLNWFSFLGNHNSVHYASYLPELHRALAESCRFAAFIDMDERLIGFSNDEWIADDKLVNRLLNTNAPLVSAPLLQNTPGQDNQFQINSGLLMGMVYWGKPIVSTSNPYLGTGRIHTVQYPVAEADFLGLGVLHLSLLSIKQRLRTNKNKLLQRGVANKESTYEEIALIPIDNRLPEPNVTARCIKEIRQLLHQQINKSTKMMLLQLMHQ